MPPLLEGAGEKSGEVSEGEVVVEA